VKRLTAAVAIAALFLVGVLVGVLGTHAFYLHELRQPGGLAAFGTRLLARDLNRRLDLDSAQKAQVETILKGTRAESAALRRDVMPRVFAILDHAHTRIDAVLTPEQRAEFKRYQARHRYRLHRFFSGG
jgi:Spy/CpxP family protein refolding chaperone